LIDGLIYTVGIILTAWLYGRGGRAEPTDHTAPESRSEVVEPEWSMWIFPALFGVMWPIMLPLWVFNKIFNE